MLWVPPDEPAATSAASAALAAPGEGSEAREPERETAGARRWHRLVACANASSFNEVQLGLWGLLAHVPQAYAQALHNATRPAGGDTATAAAAANHHG